jgi:hypothetical protein
MTIWYNLCSFGSFFPLLASCTKKNLATLAPTMAAICGNPSSHIFLRKQKQVEKYRAHTFVE